MINYVFYNLSLGSGTSFRYTPGVRVRVHYYYLAAIHRLVNLHIIIYTLNGEVYILEYNLIYILKL